MILKKQLPFGEVRGKLSLTPPQALKILGFKMKPDAIGVFLQQRNGKTVVCNLMPRNYTLTPKMQNTFNRMKGIGKIVHALYNELIISLWTQAAKEQNLPAPHLFAKVNAKSVGLPPNWKNLQLTPGKWKKPEFKCIYCKSTRKLILFLQKYYIENTQTGIVILEPTTFEIKLLKTDQQGKIVINLPEQFKNPLVFIYKTKGYESSSSALRTPGKCPKWKTSCNFRPACSKRFREMNQRS